MGACGGSAHLRCSMNIWPTISIRVSAECVVFTEGSRSCRLRPHLYLDADSPTARILSVGEPPAFGPSVGVDLFQEPLRALDYSLLLAAFLRHGLFSLRGGGSFFRLRPRICFVISDSLRAFFRHYHRGVFMAAALASGALAEHITFAHEPIA